MVMKSKPIIFASFSKLILAYLTSIHAAKMFSVKYPKMLPTNTFSIDVKLRAIARIDNCVLSPSSEVKTSMNAGIMPPYVMCLASLGSSFK